MFHVLLLKQDITKKKREFLVLEFELGDNKKYKMKIIQNNLVYTKKADRHLSELYYLVA